MDVNGDINGLTPLHLAATRDKVEVAKMLLDSGADVNKSSSRWGTPLDEACKNGHTSIVRLLLENKVDMGSEWHRKELLNNAKNSEIKKMLFEYQYSIKLPNVTALKQKFTTYVPVPAPRKRNNPKPIPVPRKRNNPNTPSR